jgi:hypothetical protein
VLLVAASAGAQEGFPLDGTWRGERQGGTSQLHLTERLSRPSFGELRYEATVDDPGAYSGVWSGGWNLRWSPGNEPFDYLCQENNRDPALMVGPQRAGSRQDP